MNWRDYIVRRPDVLFGKPTFLGTRIAVEHVLERLGNGWSEADLLDQYPQLSREHLRAAWAFAAASLASDEVILLGPAA